MQPSEVEESARARTRIDRVALALGGVTRKTRAILTPEGVALDVEIADRGTRLAAFLLDMLFWLVATGLLYAGIVLLVVGGIKATVAITLILFIAFLVRNFYFLHFELAWRGATPGKRICGLKVIDRNGGVLSASALVARNLTREVEVFLPLGLFLSLDTGGAAQAWERLATFGWVAALACLPLFNREHLRGGDLIAGTMVIAMPRTILAADMASATMAASETFVFAPRQLQAYGAYELQVLEELLRRPRSSETARLHREIAGRIARRIVWTDPVGAERIDDFLRAFYAAQRAELERAQLFGRLREDKARS